LPSSQVYFTPKLSQRGHESALNLTSQSLRSDTVLVLVEGINNEELDLLGGLDE